MHTVSHTVAHAFLQLIFPPGLTPRQRAVLHSIGEAHALAHISAGTEGTRHIRLGHAEGKKVDLSEHTSLSDDQICELLAKHLHIQDASRQFQADAAASSRARKPDASGLRTHHTTGVALKNRAACPDLEEFVASTLALVELERAAEVAATQEASLACSPATAQARGRTLLNLRVGDMEGGLLGRTLLTLVSNKGYLAGSKAAAQPELPPHKFSPHDIVAVKPNKGPGEGPPLCTGVVYRTKDTSLVVAVDDVPEEGMDQPLRIEKLANEVTYQRLKTTLNKLSKANGGSRGGGGELCPGSTLVDVCFGRTSPRFAAASPTWTPLNPSLDASQQAAIGLALAAKDVALIHGPPGTGKTTAVVELILQEVARGARVLATSASNIAVDNLVERLVRADPKMRIVRMGHPARLLPQVLDSSLEAHVLRSDNSSLAKDCRKEIKSLNSQLLKLGSRDRAERRQIRGDLRRLAKEERSRQEAAVVEVVKGAQVIASTLTGLLHHNLEYQVFDVVVVDEAAQALEAATWAGMLKASRAVLAGDHLQLPPTVVSDEAAKRGLGSTLFERLQMMYGDSCSQMLTVQYRMNTAIMQWSSDALYEGKLLAHPSVADHTLADLPEVPPTSAAAAGKKGAAAKAAIKAGAAARAQTKAKGAPADAEARQAVQPVLLLVDTAGCGFEEQQEEEGDSKANPGEAKVVMAHLNRLVQSGVRPQDIGVIAPYNAQVALLREMRADKLQGIEISSVDGFQGREKEAIIISMVRSNDNKQVGFLADKRRMNVAVTRARRHCAIICDSETVSSDPFLKDLADYFEAHGDYVSAAELVPNS